MAELGDILFGSAPSSKIETKSKKTPEQEELLKQLLGFFGEYSQSSGLGNLESTSLAGLERFAEEGAAGGSQLYQSGSDAIQRLLGQGQDDFSNFFESNIKEPLLQDFEEDVLPRISRQFGRSGFFGSDRVRTDESAREDLLRALVKGKRETVLGGRAQNLQAAGMIPGFESARGQGILAGGQVGLDERRKRLSQALQALGINPVENIATAEGGSSGLLSSFLSGAGGGELFKKFLGGKKAPVGG